MIASTPYNAKLEPLFGFVREGDYGRCKAWIEAGNPVLNPSAKKKSPLVEAASLGFFSIVEAFLDCGDWRAFQEELDAALQFAVETRHASNVQILLDRGASPEAVSWYDVFNTHSHEITRAFLAHGKEAGDLESSLDKLERGCTKAMAEFVPGRPDLHEPILRAMAEALEEVPLYSKWAADETKLPAYRKECERKAAHAARHFWLLASTGVDVHRKFETRWEKKTTILEHAVRHGTLAQLRALSPTEEDWPRMVAAAKEMGECDEQKLKYLLRCGFQLNDREDGTSTFMGQALEWHRFDAFAVAAEAGGKLPELSKYDWKHVRAAMYEKSFEPWMLPLLAGQVSEPRMEYLLDSEKCESKFGRPAGQIIADLCHPETALSPARFAALMKEEKEAHKGKKHHRAVQELRSLCRKAESEAAAPPFGRPSAPEQKIRVRSVDCSKEIWPWLFNFLDEFAAACEDLGGTCKVKKEPARYPPNATDATFRVTFLSLELPLSISEPKHAAPLYWSKKAQPGHVPSGLLEIKYGRAGQFHPLGKETDFLEFKGKSPDMAAKLFKLARRKQAEEEREEQRRKAWEEQRRQEEEKRAKREAEREERRRREEAERAKREEELAEQRKREAEENAKREKALREERQRKAEEEMLFKRLVENATLADQCRLARRFLDELESKNSATSAYDPELLARLRRIVDAKEAAARMPTLCHATAHRGGT